MSLNRGAKVFSRKWLGQPPPFFFYSCTLIKHKVRRGNNDESKWSTEGGTDKEQMTVECALFASLSLDDSWSVRRISFSSRSTSFSWSSTAASSSASFFLSSHLGNLSSSAGLHVRRRTRDSRFASLSSRARGNQRSVALSFFTIVLRKNFL